MDLIIGQPYNILYLPRQIVFFRDPKITGPLGLHEADLNNLTLFLAYVIFTSASYAVYIGCKRIRVTMKSARVEYYPVPRYSERINLFLNRVASHRNFLFYVSIRPSLFIALPVFVSGKGTNSAPVKPEIVTIPDNVVIFSAWHINCPNAEVIWLFKPNIVNGFSLIRTTANTFIRQALSLSHRLNHFIV